MNRDLLALANQYFDVLVIGGGIFGAGVARDAALRGLRVALVEKSDFASGTSSRSSKLIHGGFRYLQQHEFRLVFEASRERQILQRIAPHLVRPLPFIFPVYRGADLSLTKLRLGMTLYDCLALYRNVAPHRTLSRSATLKREPLLSGEGLRGAVLFYDCQEDDARFCIDHIVHAAELGAVCLNYCTVTGFLMREDRVVAARVRDEVGSCTFEISARAIVNAAGPWVNSVCSLTTLDASATQLSPTKGVHLLLPRLTQQHAIAFESFTDGRVMFVLPWGDHSLVGTTDTEFMGDPDAIRAEPSDIEYLMEEVHNLFPKSGISIANIITTFAGVRSLLRSDDAAPSARTREHRIARSGRNVVSLVGGKYTTFRLIAQQSVDAVFEILNRIPPACRTAEMALPNLRPSQTGQLIAESPAVYASDIAHACEHEMAIHLGDVMRRRTGLALSRAGDLETAARVARLMVPLRGWSAHDEQLQLQRYSEEWKRNLP